MLLRGFQFLTEKPSVVLVNTGEKQLEAEAEALAPFSGIENVLAMCAELEMEISQLDEADREAFEQEMGLRELSAGKLIRACYDALGAISFFTVVSDELRAWTVRKGDSAVTAAGKIHTDMARGFIRAEVVAFDDLEALGSMKEAKAKGKARLEGKEHVVQDGDIITFRFAV